MRSVATAKTGASNFLFYASTQAWLEFSNTCLRFEDSVECEGRRPRSSICLTLIVSIHACGREF